MPGLRRATVFTIHNLAHQGRLCRRRSCRARPRPRSVHPRSPRVLRQGQYAQGGLVAAASSPRCRRPTLARSRPTERRRGLDGVLAARAADLVGITNGIDYATWNPATDATLAARYDAEIPRTKSDARRPCCASSVCALSRGRARSIPVGRMVPQKGSDLLRSRFCPSSCRRRAVSCCWARRSGAHGRAEAAVAQPRSRCVRGGASEPVVHRLFAGAESCSFRRDSSLCGLVQMYGQRYGALPVAHATGGSATPWSIATRRSKRERGFFFHEPTRSGLLGGRPARDRRLRVAALARAAAQGHAARSRVGPPSAPLRTSVPLGGQPLSRHRAASVNRLAEVAARAAPRATTNQRAKTPAAVRLPGVRA